MNQTFLAYHLYYSYFEKRNYSNCWKLFFLPLNSSDVKTVDVELRYMKNTVFYKTVQLMHADKQQYTVDDYGVR